MNTIGSHFKTFNTFLLLVSLISGLIIVNAQGNEEAQSNKPETDLHPEIFWDIKAYRPNLDLLNIKAIASDGKMYDVKAIQYAEDTSLLDVKVLMNGERLPIKLIINKKSRLFPLKGIDKNGNIIDIKAITEKGEILDVKGISKSGNIINIRAIAEYGMFYNIIALSPEGKVNNVKGLKMLSTTLEGTINGVDIFAHVKAMQQD